MKRSLFKLFYAVTFGTAVALTATATILKPQMGAGPAWLISITAVTLATFGYDKLIAGKTLTRVPEKVLLSLVIAGGTVGALAGMSLFRHKTIKSSFRRKLWLIIVAQAVLLAGYFYWYNP